MVAWQERSNLSHDVPYTVLLCDRRQHRGTLRKQLLKQRCGTELLIANGSALLTVVTVERQRFVTQKRVTNRRSNLTPCSITTPCPHRRPRPLPSLRETPPCSALFALLRRVEPRLRTAPSLQPCSAAAVGALGSAMFGAQQGRSAGGELGGPRR